MTPDSGILARNTIKAGCVHHITFFARVVIMALLALTVSSACAQAPASSATVPVTAPTATAQSAIIPTPYPPGFIPHPTGQTDVVLQVAQPDGFFPAAFRRTRAPHLTLYGDGTAYFLSNKEDFLNGRLYTTRLDEPEVQDLLRFAIQHSRIFSSRDRYPDPTGGADAFWTTILVRADGKEITTSAYNLVPLQSRPSDWSAEDVEQWGRLVLLKERLDKAIVDLEQDPESRRHIADAVTLYVERPPAHRLDADPSQEIHPWPLTEVDLGNLAAQEGASRAAVLDGGAAWAVQLKLPLHAIRLYRDQDIVYRIGYLPRLPADWTWNAAPPPHVGSYSPVPFAEMPATLAPESLCAGLRFNLPTPLGPNPTGRVKLALDGRDVTPSLMWVISLDASLGNACYTLPAPLSPGDHTATLSYTTQAAVPYAFTWSFTTR